MVGSCRAAGYAGSKLSDAAADVRIAKETSSKRLRRPPNARFTLGGNLEVHCPDGAAHEPAERHRHPATSNGRLRAAGEVRRRRPGRDRAADALISVAFQGDLAAKRAIQIDEVDRRQRTGDRPPDQTDP